MELEKYDLKKDDLSLQTGDEVFILLSDEEVIEGYWDGTIRFDAKAQDWMLQIRTGVTDATDVYTDDILKISVQV